MQDIAFFPAKSKKTDTIYSGVYFGGSIICFSQESKMNGGFCEDSLHKFS